MYYYKQTNGNIMSSPDIVVKPVGEWAYFDSPFIEDWWYVPDNKMEQLDYCPKCKNDIDSLNYEWDLEGKCYRVECLDCGLKWTENYKFEGIEFIGE